MLDRGYCAGDSPGRSRKPRGLLSKWAHHLGLTPGPLSNEPLSGGHG